MSPGFSDNDSATPSDGIYGDSGSANSASPSDIDVQLNRAAANTRVQSFFSKGHGESLGADGTRVSDKPMSFDDKFKTGHIDIDSHSHAKRRDIDDPMSSVSNSDAEPMSADATPVSDTRQTNDGGDSSSSTSEPKIRAAGEDISSEEAMDKKLGSVKNKLWEVQDESQMALKYYTKYYTRGVTQLTTIG